MQRIDEDLNLPQKGGDDYCVTIYISEPLASRELLDEDLHGGEGGEALKRRMKNEVAAWCPQCVNSLLDFRDPTSDGRILTIPCRVTKLVSLVEITEYSPVFDYTSPEGWVNKSGRLAVFGGAAHPLLVRPLRFHVHFYLVTDVSFFQPFSHQESAMSLEDAVTLSEILRRSRGRARFALSDVSGLVPYVLRSFETVRRSRCIQAQFMLRSGRLLFHLPDGEDQRRRDAAFRAGGLLNEEEQQVELVFDPIEAVDDWWKKEQMTRAE